MSVRYYRGVEFIKDHFVKYLNYIFLAEEKEQVSFWDGNRQAKFSSRPKAIKRAAWDFRSIPCVLIGAASGNFKIISFTNDLIDYGTTNIEYGGDIETSIEFEIWASSMEERDKLTDIVCIYLSHPMARTYFEKYYIRLPEAASFRDGGEVMQPQIDYPVYRNNVTMRAIGTWRDSTGSPDTLSELFINITLSIDLDS